ncbi:hypothetical protein NUU61_003277 [Penicillium alfredii]|uniref:FAD dependent oxidoreductase domain-containing protein n=1 Tax=Penicillium alfredii TaxID=1506179 RepID=A0A9W9KGR9_9EURO|nr:uncharacterized protein NUU61_003277 [Penicillium alfredii]KAJ5105930.1 hypothetical protein NUU61_003277 [Penicillium alfredii]
MQAILSIIRNACLTLRALVSEISATKQCFDALLSRVSTLALPVPNPSNAFWQQYPPFPDLVNCQSQQLPGTADILIVGSGISGASVAYTALKQAHSHAHPQPPPRVVVLEARSICSGATGRNGGHIKCSAYLEYASLKARFGKERAKALLEFQLSHMPILLDLIQRNEELKCAEAREVQSVDTFTDEKTWVKTKRTVEEFRRDVPDLAGDVVIHEGVDACTEFGVDPQHCYGIITYKAATLWPYRFVTALYSSLLSAHPELISLEANTPATEIRVNPEDSERPFTVQTPPGEQFQQGTSSTPPTPSQRTLSPA